MTKTLSPRAFTALVIAVALAVLAGCTPSSDSIVGTWKSDDGGVLEIHEDGTVDLTSFRWSCAEDSKFTWYSGPGEWERGSGSVLMYFPPIDGQRGDLQGELFFEILHGDRLDNNTCNVDGPPTQVFVKSI